MLNSLEHLVQLIGGTNKNHDEKRYVLKDLSLGKPNPRSIPTNSYMHHVYIDNGVYDRWSIGDLTHNQPFNRCIFEFDEIHFYEVKFYKNRFINWLSKLETYFYFNKILCY